MARSQIHKADASGTHGTGKYLEYAPDVHRFLVGENLLPTLFLHDSSSLHYTCDEELELFAEDELNGTGPTFEILQL